VAVGKGGEAAEQLVARLRARLRESLDLNRRAEPPSCAHCASEAGKGAGAGAEKGAGAGAGSGAGAGRRRSTRRRTRSSWRRAPSPPLRAAPAQRAAPKGGPCNSVRKLRAPRACGAPTKLAQSMPAPQSLPPLLCILATV
jgi:hypothetical protein